MFLKLSWQTSSSQYIQVCGVKLYNPLHFEILLMKVYSELAHIDYRSFWAIQK